MCFFNDTAVCHQFSCARDQAAIKTGENSISSTSFVKVVFISIISL